MEQRKIMRLVVGMLACLGASALTVALADPPASPPSTATSPAASAPAPAPKKSESLKDEFTPDENHFVQEGYHMEMRHGTRMFCRYEVDSGSRVTRQKICGTVEELRSAENQSQGAFNHGQTQGGQH